MVPIEDPMVDSYAGTSLNLLYQRKLCDPTKMPSMVLWCTAMPGSADELNTEAIYVTDVRVIL